LALVLTSVAGCSDSFDQIFHDILAFYNEVADVMLRTDDEETAKEVMAIQNKLYKAKWDRIKDRLAKRVDQMDKEQREDMANAFLDYYDEMKATADRLTHATARLKAVIAAINEKDSSASTASLKSLADLPNSFKIQGPAGSSQGLVPGPPPPPAKKK
jgi:hypothetical protein